MALLCYFATLLFSERLASHDVVSILIWTGSVLSAVIGALHAGNSSDKIKKLDVGLNLLTTVSLFMALRYTSLSGFAISQIARHAIVGILEQQACSRSKCIIYLMLAIAVALQMRVESLGLLISQVYGYLEDLNEQRSGDNASRAKFYSSALLSVLAMPLAFIELTRQTWTDSAWFTAMELLIAVSFAYHNWSKQEMTNKTHLVVGLASVGLVSLVSSAFYPLTFIALALSVASFFMSQRFDNNSSQVLAVNEVKYSNIALTTLAVTVAISFAIFYGLSLTTTSEWVLPAVRFNALSIDAYYDVPYSASLIPFDKAQDAMRLQCLFKARKTINERVSNLLADSEALALMDVPLHWNLGDSFIWHGDNLFIGLQSLPVATLRDPEQRELDTLRSSSDNVTLLLHGGGNFGDWWRENADFRLKVLNELPKNRVIFLPQSIHYREDKYIAQDREAFEKHDKLTLLLRDCPSLQFARANFPHTESLFVPDMAFMIGPLAPASDPMFDIMFLLRTDTEKSINDTHLDRAKRIAREKQLSYEIWDFPVAGYPIPESIASRHSVMYDYRKLYPNISAQDIPKDILPLFRVAMGNKLLSRGSVIITDRLHASILGVLMGRPVIYVDNAYKKLSNIWSSMALQVPDCSGNNLRTRHADTVDSAVELAYELIRDTRK